MFVVASEMSVLSSAEALSIAVESGLRYMFGSNVETSDQLSGYAWFLGRTLDVFGGMMARKIINFTSLGQPVIMCPLLLNGREWSGGIPSRKLEHSIFDTTFSKWKTEADRSFGAWKEQFFDEIMTSINKYTGQYSQGSFSKGWGSSSIKKK